jgi:hypothetical protein
MRQARIKRTSYMDPKDQPSDEERHRMTTCQCERSNPVSEELLDESGRRTVDASCLKCGRAL